MRDTVKFGHEKWFSDMVLEVARGLEGVYQMRNEIPGAIVAFHLWTPTNDDYREGKGSGL